MTAASEGEAARPIDPVAGPTHGFQTARRAPPQSACRFYHSMDLPGLGTIEGVWDLRGRFADYTGHVDLAGRRVLDVGTATGFLSFSAEAAGATVTSFDAADASRFEIIPHGHVRADPDGAARTYADILERTKNGYWFCHDRLGSRCPVYYGGVYDIGPALGDHDVVLVGQILVHLKNPLVALDRIADRCRDTLVITEGMTDDTEPTATFLGDPARPDQLRAWWHFSVPFFLRYLGILGFTLASRQRGLYRCRAAGHAPEIELTTLVFRRSDAHQAASTP